MVKEFDAERDTTLWDRVGENIHHEMPSWLNLATGAWAVLIILAVASHLLLPWKF